MCGCVCVGVDHVAGGAIDTGGKDQNDWVRTSA